MTANSTLLIVGARSHLAQAVIPGLAPHFHLVGADVASPKEAKDLPFPFYQLQYTKRPFADIFRLHKIDALLYLGRIGSTARVTTRYRYEQNVLGVKACLSYGLTRGVKHFVMVSTHQVYGASPKNHLYFTEDEPLLAHASLPSLSDAVEMDHEATEFMWRHRSIKMTVLRPVHVIGPGIESPLTLAMRRKWSPALLGYDPLIQVIHQDDFQQALLKVLKKPRSGVFNLAGEGVAPYSSVLRVAGAEVVPVPQFMFRTLFSCTRFRWHQHVLNLMKYPIIIDDRLLRSVYGFNPSYSMRKALLSV